MKHEVQINRQRNRRRLRNRNRVKRDSIRLRLSVFRSHRHIYAQIIDDEQGRTVAAASTMDKTVRDGLSYGGNRDAAELVGKAIAERALEAGVQQVAFDRGDYRYHGRVAALADAARDAGLDVGPKKEVVEPKKPEAKKKKPKKKSQSKKS